MNHPAQRCPREDFKCYLSQLSVELLENSSHSLDALDVLMDVSCAFKTIIGSPCSYDRRDKSKLITEVPLVSCNKDMKIISPSGLLLVLMASRNLFSLEQVS